MNEEQQQHRDDTNILQDILSYTMVLFCECWKLGNNNEKKIKSSSGFQWNNDDSMQLITSSDPIEFKCIVIPKYRILRQNQCRLLWLLSRVTDLASTNNNIDEDDYRSRSIDRLGWYDIWDRCEQYKNELFVVDSYTGRTPLHIALVKLSSSNNNYNNNNSNSINESVNAEYAMWVHVIESMIELNPHSLIIIDKHNYTPIHLVCNISKIVQSSTTSSSQTKGTQQQESLFHLFAMIIKSIINLPKLYNLPADELSIVSIAKKPTSQSIQPPSPLLLLCRKNSSVDALYWILQTKKVTTLSWIAPWTGGEIIQDIVTLRKHHDNTKNNKSQQQFLCNDNLHWNLLRTHETPLETLLLIPDENNVYGKRIFSMIKIVQEYNEECILWKDIACNLYNLLQNENNDDEFYNDNGKTYYDNSIRNVIDEFVLSKYPMKSVATVEKLTTTSNMNNNNNISSTVEENVNNPEECIQEFRSHIQNNRALWIKSIMLLHSSTTTSYKNDDESHCCNDDDDNITKFGNKKSIEALVYTVSCLYRPIPELLQLVAIIFPEQLYRKSFDHTHNHNNSNHNISAVHVPLNQVLVLLPIYESEEKRQEGSYKTSSIIRKKNNIIKSPIPVQNEFIQGIDNIPRKLSRERNNLYMHTRFDFTSPSSRNDNDNESSFDIEEGIIDINYLNNSHFFFANSVSKILETQIRVLVEAQPDSLVMPITVSIIEQNIYLKYYFYNNNEEERIHGTTTNINTTKRLPFWIRDLVFQEQQPQQEDDDEEEMNHNHQLLELAYYPFFVAAVHNCSLDTIYRMIRYAPEALQLQQF